MEAWANVSVDVDGLACYHQIHGLLDPADPTLMYRVAMPRLRELFREHGVRATFFVITRDLIHEEAVTELRTCLDEGHEVASHTHQHPYNLREWSERGMMAEIAQAEHELSDRLGVRPVGFRTPGYNCDTRLIRILAERGYRYDSSVFPCPPYYVAKAAVLGAMAITGRESGSTMTDASALLAPLQPYRPSRWSFARPGDRKHSLPIWEIPIGVLPGVRLPVIGTTIAATPRAAVPLLYRAFRLGQPTLQVELHAIDLIDHQDPCIDTQLVRRQPDLRRAWTDKRASLSRFFELIRRDYGWATLAELSAYLDDAAGPTVIESS